MITSCGARPTNEGTYFSVWAPTAERVDVVVYRSEETREEHSTVHSMSKSADGIFRTLVSDVREGALYKYRVDGKGPFPDPVSRFQPKTVHGPSQVLDMGHYQWTDHAWRGVESLDRLVVYELHVGTFSDRGNYDGVREKLKYLKELGVAVVQLMPLGDFPGQRNWGYDGVCLYAPARCYGTPDELRRLIDAAHELGLGVFLDCVYNHLGPDGNYTACFSPYYFTDRAKTPWGAAVNVDPLLDAQHAAHVRRFLIESAQCWVRDYHFDGLRLDATHAIVDSSTPHFLAVLAAAVHDAAAPGKHVCVLAEDDRNDASLLLPPPAGAGLDGLWADDAHHQLRVLLTGTREGYFADFSGTAEDLARTLMAGWFFTGQSKANGERRGTDPRVVERLAAFTVCIENHDQVGNTPIGHRLAHVVDAARYAAASTLLLLSPETPLLFQGQEWAATSPFAFFTDHNAELGKLVTEGRRREFSHFSGFADPEKIPDPQSEITFTTSKLRWSESVEAPTHAATLQLYSTLLHLRATEPACGSSLRTLTDVLALGPHTLALVRRAAPPSDAVLLVLVHMQNESIKIELGSVRSPLLPAGRRATEAYHTDAARLDTATDTAVFKAAGGLVLRV